MTFKVIPTTAPQYLSLHRHHATLQIRFYVYVDMTLTTDKEEQRAGSCKWRHKTAE